jgi:hypothetical protein
VADGQLAAFVVAEELCPFFVGGDAVFIGGAQGAAAGQERQVVGDDFLGVGGLVAESDVDVAVPGDDLGDVRRRPGRAGVGDEHPPEVVRGKGQRLPGRASQAGAGQRRVEHVADGAVGDGPELGAAAALE